MEGSRDAPAAAVDHAGDEGNDGEGNLEGGNETAAVGDEQHGLFMGEGGMRREQRLREVERE